MEKISPSQYVQHTRVVGDKLCRPILISFQNWLWFRVMTNLALIKVCGVPQEEVLDAMKADLDLMEQFYLGLCSLPLITLTSVLTSH